VPMLAEARSRVDVPARQRSAVRCLTGETRAMHADPELDGALFQVASQFNLLEMMGSAVTPKDRVTVDSHRAAAHSRTDRCCPSSCLPDPTLLAPTCRYR
jgi:hypothetical protein